MSFGATPSLPISGLARKEQEMIGRKLSKRSWPVARGVMLASPSGCSDEGRARTAPPQAAVATAKRSSSRR